MRTTSSLGPTGAKAIAATAEAYAESHQHRVSIAIVDGSTRAAPAPHEERSTTGRCALHVMPWFADDVDTGAQLQRRRAGHDVDLTRRLQIAI